MISMLVEVSRSLAPSSPGTQAAWDLAAQALVALAPVLLAALSWLSLRAAQLITAKVRHEYVRGVLLRLDDAVFVAVREVQQLLVERLREASADGHLSAEERQSVKLAAVEAVRSYVGPKGLLEMGRILGLGDKDLDRVLAPRVEAAVYELNARAKIMNGAHR